MGFWSKIPHNALHFSRKGILTYTTFSNTWPHTAAGMTAFLVLGSADITAQFLERRYGARAGAWDRRRTLALVTFGIWYYGGPCKWFYLRYPGFFERVMPHSSRVTQKLMAAVIDCGLVTPSILIPSYYLITLGIQGESLQNIWKCYKEDFVEATLGTFFYWCPIVTFNFYFIPQHSQILLVVVGSFIHKCWLSWVSNRHTNPNQTDTPYSNAYKKLMKFLKPEESEDETN